MNLQLRIFAVWLQRIGQGTRTLIVSYVLLRVGKSFVSSSRHQSQSRVNPFTLDASNRSEINKTPGKLQEIHREKFDVPPAYPPPFSLRAAALLLGRLYPPCKMWHTCTWLLPSH